MQTSSSSQADSETYPRIAPVFHTVFLLLMLGVWALWSRVQVDHMRDLATPDRVGLYTRTLVFEWSLFFYAILGVWLTGEPFSIVLGERWKSFREALRNIGIAAAFWFVALILLIVFGLLLRVASAGSDIKFLLPQGRLEIILWIALSITAGICEETIFRGYLQHQLISLTKNIPTGIFLSAVVFGAGHIYQGFRRAILIILFGLMFGILAHWRKSTRPGMIAHAWHDCFSGLLGGVLRH